MKMIITQKSTKMKELQSKIIGTLKPYEYDDDSWESKPVKIPFFENQEFKIIYSDFVPEEDLEEADLAIEAFLKNEKPEREAISHLVYKNCMDFLSMVEYDDADKELWDIKDKNEIWKFVDPTQILVTRRPYKDQDMYVQITCNCEWEEEHGLQIVLRQGKQVTRVSGIDGHLTEADAYNKPDSEDQLLSQFKD